MSKSTVIFSFLSSSKASIDSFISQARKIMGTHDTTSNHYKFDVYKKSYDVEFRHKYTGFERLEELDKKTRLLLSEYLGSSELEDYYTEELTDEQHLDFREELKNNAELCEDTYNLLYLSGGIDSEVTALAFIDASVEFVPVIFKWTDEHSEIINEYDTQHAFVFCEKHNLTPIVRVFDVETFWKSKELYVYADKYKYSSPQILTYYKMIDIIDKEISNEYK